MRDAVARVGMGKALAKGSEDSSDTKGLGGRGHGLSGLSHAVSRTRGARTVLLGGLLAVWRVLRYMMVGQCWCHTGESATAGSGAQSSAGWHSSSVSRGHRVIFVGERVC